MRRIVAVALFAAGAVLALAPPARAENPAPAWSRARYEVQADGPVPRVAYTVLQPTKPGPVRSARILLTDAAGRHLFAEARVKGAGGATADASRWFSVGILGNRNVLSVAIVSRQVELRVGLSLVASYERGSEHSPESRATLDKIRGSFPAELLSAVSIVATIGLAREPVFAEEAAMLADALSLNVKTLKSEPSRRRRIAFTDDFDPARNPPLPDEAAFGRFYGIPGR